MPVKIYLEKPIAGEETYALAEATDLVYRRMRNIGYARRYAKLALPRQFTALQAAAAKIIMTTPVGIHPVRVINNRNLAVLRVGDVSARRALCLGLEGRLYPSLRGILYGNGNFEPTAERLSTGFALFSAKDSVVLTKISTLRPSLGYLT